ncbi:MAG: LacI family DNA-binding transcriptional regulator [Actinomycetaceae bacterium]|nr:LacI family DNA-binding transcriptional regulator [Actinomycetaceae bacterium]MDY6082605.1 LacI family DNA-binding transcriptional regulator [Actinomycetaceae bacterium]
MPKHVVIADVAARAGVSAQTVSRVLTGRGAVSEPTRAKVNAAIRELNYHPNLAARALAAGATPAIGVLMMGELSFGRAQSYTQFVQMQSDRSVFVLSLAVSPSDDRAMASAMGYFSAANVQAIVLMGQNWEAMCRVYPLASQPVIAVINKELPGDVSRVELEQHKSTTLLLRHLYDRGARRIVHISPRVVDVDARLRRDAYQEFCTRYGLEQRIVDVGNWSAEEGYRAGEALVAGEAATTGKFAAERRAAGSADPLEGGSRGDLGFDAIFAANDFLALGVSRALRDAAQLTPGRDYALAGYDDLTLDAYMSPSLTTVRQNYRLLAATISRQIESRLKGEDPRVAVLPNDVVIRESSSLFSAR